MTTSKIEIKEINKLLEKSLNEINEIGYLKLSRYERKTFLTDSESISIPKVFLLYLLRLPILLKLENETKV